MCAGGYDGKGNEIDTVHMYMSEGDQWIAMPSMQCRRSDAAMAELNGVLYVCGGWNETYGYLDSIECFDTAEWRWIRIAAQMKTKRTGHALVCLDKCLYAVGGRDGSVYLNSVEALPLYKQSKNDSGSTNTTTQPLAIPQMLDEHSWFACVVHRV